MRLLSIFLFLFLNFSARAQQDSATVFANTITSQDLKTYLTAIASKSFEGRETGEKGQKKAAKYLSEFYASLGIKALGDSTYLQTYLFEKSSINKRGKTKNTSTYGDNVIAFIKGSAYPNEVVVLSAHYDHLGKRGKRIFYGADDDGSGTAAVMEIAQAFKIAEKQGVSPKRSILIINFSGEEKGLLGSEYYCEHPVFPLANTVVDLNIDMIGRADEQHKADSNYIYLIGSDRLSKDLHLLSEETNKKYFNFFLDYTYNRIGDPNKFYYRSDHYNFAKNNVPVIFYFSGVHSDYHEITDTVDKINFNRLEQRTRLVFYTAWQIANRTDRLKLN